MAVVGFDIGSENSYIAAVKSGGIEILDNEYNLRSTPTYIAFTEHSREIGVAARNKVVTNLENTVFGIKRILGKKVEDCENDNELTYLPHEKIKLPSGDVGIKVSYLKNSVVFSIQQLMAMMLTKLKMISEVKLGNTVRDCVISVPVYYTDAQRRAMLEAAKIAGLNAVKLINESAAVALAYGFFKQNVSDEPRNVVFVDLGNSVLTVTACVFTKDKVKTLGCVWDDVGGRDFDVKLVKYFVDDFKIKYQLDVLANKRAVIALMLECERLKKLMSTNSLEVTFQIECFMQDKDVSGRMKREDFEKLAADILKRIELTFRRILKETKLNAEQIHSVEIVGGACRMPAVKQLIRKIFGREPNATLNQDEAVARGCALQCALLSPLLKTRNFFVEDIPSYVIKIMWKNVASQDEELEVFSLSDRVPACKSVTISMSKPFSLEAHYVDLYDNVRKIGSYTFENIPQDVERDGHMKVKLIVSLNIHGIFSLTSAKMFSKSMENQESMNKNEDESKSTMPGSENEENVSTDQVTLDEKSSSAVKLYELTVNSDVLGLTNEELKEYINTEQQMIRAEVGEKEKANARNGLEEYVYDARAKLGHEFLDYVTENKRTNLLEYLYEIENWLYDNEELEASDYCKQLREVKSNIEPIFKRYTEWQQIPSVIDEYQRSLQTAFDTVSNLASTEKSTDISSDVENLRKMCENSKQYLDQFIECFFQLKMHEDLPLTVEDLRNSLANFQKEFQCSLWDLKRKIESYKEATVISGDGIAQDPHHSTQDKSPNTPVDKPDNSSAPMKGEDMPPV